MSKRTWGLDLANRKSLPDGCGQASGPKPQAYARVGGLASCILTPWVGVAGGLVRATLC